MVMTWRQFPFTRKEPLVSLDLLRLSVHICGLAPSHRPALCRLQWEPGNEATHFGLDSLINVLLN